MAYADDRCNGLIPGQINNASMGVDGSIPGQGNQPNLTSPTEISQTNQNAAAKPRPGPPQKPVIERIPRSLFLFTLDNKFRKG